MLDEQTAQPLSQACMAACAGGTQGKRKQAAQPEAPGGTSRHAKPALLLGHLCSVVTSVACSPDGRFVATTDKDRKARVSHLPRDPQQVSMAHQVTSRRAQLGQGVACWGVTPCSTLARIDAQPHKSFTSAVAHEGLCGRCTQVSCTGRRPSCRSAGQAVACQQMLAGAPSWSKCWPEGVQLAARRTAAGAQAEWWRMPLHVHNTWLRASICQIGHTTPSVCPRF